MIPESVDNEELIVCYSGTQKGYVDTGLTVEITNGVTGDVWEDYIPLRFFSSVLPITFSGESIKNNENGALNGFILMVILSSLLFAAVERKPFMFLSSIHRMNIQLLSAVPQLQKILIQMQKYFMV